MPVVMGYFNLTYNAACMRAHGKQIHWAGTPYLKLAAISHLIKWVYIVLLHVNANVITGNPQYCTSNSYCKLCGLSVITLVFTCKSTT